MLLFWAAAPPAWAPASLFASGEKGGWYDTSDFSSMFQDSAGTTPVTAAGQPVGKILDKSGNGNHLIQATTANRPTLFQDAGGNYGLSFNGTNSQMASAASISGFTTVGTIAVGQKLGLSSGAGYMAGVVATNGMSTYVNTSATAYTMDNGSALAGGVEDQNAHVLMANFLGTTSSFLERDKTTLATGNAGSFSVGNSAQILLGRLGTIPFLNGILYQIVAINRSLTAAEKSKLWTFMGNKEGLSL